MKYTLLPNEVVVLKADSAIRGRSTSCELMLTNLNLVVTAKNAFGGAKSVDCYPVNQIKVYNGQAQAKLSTTRGLDVLAIYFRHGEEEFRFSTGGKRTIQTWVATINETVTGQPAVVASPSVAPGAERVVGMLKDTLGAFKSIRSSKTEEPAPTAVATKCGSCGAPISGMRGQRVTCGYCDSAQHL